MKTLLGSLGLLLVLNSCVFEEPFETEAKIPVNPALPGRWEEMAADAQNAKQTMLVLEHSAYEYLVEYPVGEKAMFFRIFAVELAADRLMQAQLIGTADGPVKPHDRKYHLLKVSLYGDAMEMRTLRPEALGDDVRTTAQLREALAAHVNEADLFAEPVKFRRKN